jgi:hypothetical protein
MQQPPNQYATERLLSDAVSHGDKSKLADVLGVSLSEISQQMNPEEPKKSDYYRFKRMLWALVGINPEAARLVFSDLEASMDAWTGDPKAGERNLSALTAKVLKETGDLITARLEGQSAHVIRKETLEVKSAADQVLAAIDQTANALREVKR